MEKRISLENSAFINAAYRTLRDPIERVEYLLQLEKNPVEKNQKQPPADLFEEIFEIQETIEEYRNSKEAGLASNEVLEGRLREEKKELEGKRSELEGRLQTLFGLWDRLVKDDISGDVKKEDRNRVLGEMREILAKRSYLNTIIRDIGRELES
jgi:molecular chaperone HscB